MKQALKLSLAISLALAGGQAYALGLGQVQVKSRLNQPLEAEIPVIVDRRGEADDLVVALASAEEFARIGMERSQVGVPLEFKVVRNARGEPVVRITSTEAVRAPFVDFLLEANWNNGRVLREYTILLDPPLTAPAAAVAVEPAPPRAVAAPTLAVQKPAMPQPAAEARAVERTTVTKPVEAPPPPAPPPPVAKPAPPPVAATPAPVKPSPSAPRPASKPLPPSVAAASGTHYGPVAAGETLWEIAQATLPDDGVSMNQLMLALLKANPEAFSRNNINRLKRGAVLRIPSDNEIRAVGSRSVAAAQVRAQIAEWRGEAATPTLLAGSAATLPSTASSGTATGAAKRPDDRLALVPPEMNRDDGLASAGQAGSSAGAANGNVTAAELARANESLTARNQEVGELRSRVQDLETIQQKSERLISLKDSEIADLQRKLAQLQSATLASSAAVAPAPAVDAAESKPAVPSESAEPPPPVPADASRDIWGHAAVPDSAAQPTAGATASSAVADQSTVGEASSAAMVDPVHAATDGDGSVSPGGSDAVALGVEAPSTVETSPLAAPSQTTSEPLDDDRPWYLDPRVLGGAGLLALLGGWLALRTRRGTRPAVNPRPSLADSFAAGPAAGAVVVASEFDDDSMNAIGDEERQLREQIAARPDDLGARLELLSIYYADNRVGEFRAAAADMHAIVDDPAEPEWVQVRAMGEDLLPDDPLFSGNVRSAVETAVVDAAPATVSGLDREWSPAVDTIRSIDERTESRASSSSATRFDESRYAPARESLLERIEIDDSVVEPMVETRDGGWRGDAGDLSYSLDSEDLHGTRVGVDHPVTSVEAVRHDESFDFDLPPLDFDSEFSKPRSDASSSIAETGAGDADDDFFVGEDALATKLDLARAYVDMGDPDGARAMLEEVIADGDSGQKEQARRLLADLG